MIKKTLSFLVLILFIGGIGFSAVAVSKTDKSKQCVIWSSGDKEVATKLVYMYVYNSKKWKWMDTVRLLIWGPSAKLLSEDKELQEGLKKLTSVGVELMACKACADLYKVSDKLSKLGITVKYTGKLLAEMQKTGWHILTF